MLISQCQLAKMILSSAAPDPDRESALATLRSNHTLRMIEEELEMSMAVRIRAKMAQRRVDDAAADWTVSRRMWPATR